MTYEDILKNIREGGYMPSFRLSARPIKPKLDTTNVTSEKALKYANDLAKYETLMEEWKKESETYYAELSMKREQFREDVKAAFGTEGNPKEPLLWDKAYERHSGGMEEVLNEYYNLVDLIL